LHAGRFIAARLGVKIEEYLLRAKLASAITTRERERLARDLHDGVLQGLAAASIQLKLCGDSLPSDAQNKLKRVRSLLADEAQRIRAFVEETRAAPTPASGLVQLSEDLDRRVRALRNQWGVEVKLELRPSEITTSVSLARNVRHLLTEAVSNAVRHGGASLINASVERSADRLLVRIETATVSII